MWCICFSGLLVFDLQVVSRFNLAIALSVLEGLIVLQIIGTCLALCLSSDLKSLSVVTEVAANGAAEVSYFQVSIDYLILKID